MPKPRPRLSLDEPSQARVEGKLRSMYDRTPNEVVPDHLRHLIQVLQHLDCSIDALNPATDQLADMVGLEAVDPLQAGHLEGPTAARAAMFWAMRVFPEDGWFAVQDQFEDEWDRAGEPSDMMLVYADEPGARARICVGLPDRALLSAYAGFDEIAASQLPLGVSLLMGSHDEFRRLFANVR